MNKEQLLQQLDEKYQPLLRDTGDEQSRAEQAHRDLLSEYEQKRASIEAYYQAIEDQERIENIINNPPTI